MNYKIIPTEFFKQQVRNLGKTYPSIRKDLKELSTLLKKDPESGTSLGKHVYKIRLKSSDMDREKGAAIGLSLILLTSRAKQGF